MDLVESLCASGQLDIQASFTQAENNLKSELQKAEEMAKQAIQNAQNQKGSGNSGSAL